MYLIYKHHDGFIRTMIDRKQHLLSDDKKTMIISDYSTEIEKTIPTELGYVYTSWGKKTSLTKKIWALLKYLYYLKCDFFGSNLKHENNMLYLWNEPSKKVLLYCVNVWIDANTDKWAITFF